MENSETTPALIKFGNTLSHSAPTAQSTKEISVIAALFIRAAITEGQKLLASEVLPPEESKKGASFAHAFVAEIISEGTRIVDVAKQGETSPSKTPKFDRIPSETPKVDKMATLRKKLIAKVEPFLGP